MRMTSAAVTGPSVGNGCLPSRTGSACQLKMDSRCFRVCMDEIANCCGVHSQLTDSLPEQARFVVYGDQRPRSRHESDTSITNEM